MKNYTIRPYESGDFEMWNSFLAKAKNATFLFHRDFMEYHKDRFEDFSLLIFDEKKLVALLPANKKDNEIFSHQGLTYGGLVYEASVKAEAVIAIFKSLLEFLEQRQITKFIIKLLPSVYHLTPAHEIDYALFLSEAKLVRRDMLSVVCPADIKYSDSRKRGIERGFLAYLEIKEETDFTGFWNNILIPNLSKRHDVKPVHSLAEIQNLKAKFPESIRQFNVYHNDEIVAGTTIFETGRVAHSQYMSANETKNELGSLDFLHDYLLKTVFKDKAFFDFGISNEENGKKLNAGLAYWKSGFGGGIVPHDFYEVETKNHIRLADVLK